ncbi:MAG: hypothetical protein KF857_10935 [Fimbriimonadaceae bacterium]|nr:hypothetical protein [Fimbriimonadaceae bacterium]
MRKESGRGGLVGVIAAAAVALVLVLVFTNGSSIFGGKKEPERADGQGKTLVGKSLLKAKDTVCLEQLQEDRQMIQVATDPVEETKPASLAEAKVTGDLARCPIGKEPYVYDPATGSIHCPHPGHEKY